MNETETRKGGYDHAEAFCLMEYATDDGAEHEILWNSRDGVTPFVIQSRQGREMRHINWQRDAFAPSHKPRPGDRIFVDMTRQGALDLAVRMVDRYWDAPDGQMRSMYESRDDAINSLAESYYKPGAPMVVEAGRYEGLA